MEESVLAIAPPGGIALGMLPLEKSIELGGIGTAGAVHVG